MPQRLLVIGASNINRLVKSLPADTPAPHASLVLARSGLHATEGEKFILDRRQQIAAFQPTHIVLHLGFCDLVPRESDARPLPVAVLFQLVRYVVYIISNVCQP